MLKGIPMSRCACSMAFVASPSEPFRARLKEIVTAGNWPWCVTARGALWVSKWLNVLSGTAAPLTAVVAVGFAEPDATRIELDGPVVPAPGAPAVVAVISVLALLALDPDAPDPEVVVLEIEVGASTDRT